MGESPEPAVKTGGSATRRSTILGATAGVATLFLLLRLLAVSDWNWRTAAAVAETFDFATALPTVLGTLFAEPVLTGILLAVLLPLSVIEIVWPAVPPRRWSIAGMLFPAALLAATATWILSFHDVWLVAVMLGVAAAVVLLRLLVRKGVGHDIVVRLLKSVGVLSAVGLLLLALFVDTPWMARERIVTSDGTIHGYVLAAEAGYIRILTDDRDVLIYNSSDVASRDIVD